MYTYATYWVNQVATLESRNINKKQKNKGGNEPVQTELLTWVEPRADFAHARAVLLEKCNNEDKLDAFNPR